MEISCMYVALLTPHLHLPLLTSFQLVGGHGSRPRFQPFIGWADGSTHIRLTSLQRSTKSLFISQIMDNTGQVDQAEFMGLKKEMASPYVSGSESLEAHDKADELQGSSLISIPPRDV